MLKIVCVSIFLLLTGCVSNGGYDKNRFKSHGDVECTVGIKPMVIIMNGVSDELRKKLKDENFKLAYDVRSDGVPINIKYKTNIPSKELKNVLSEFRKWKFRMEVVEGKTYSQLNCSIEIGKWL